MPLTFGEAKKTLAQYAGRAGFCASSDEVVNFTRKVLQHLLFKGQYGNLRKFCFCSARGCVTLPPEVEIVEKVAIDGEIGTSWSKWMEYHQGNQLFGRLCPGNEMYEEANYFSTVYDLPAGGSRVGVIGTCDEDEHAHVLIQGKDPTGRDIFTVHNGQQIHGEYLSIRKGQMHYTNYTFGEITSVLKSLTNGNVQLIWVLPDINQHGFLADYSPVEEKPSYRRVRITTPNCPSFMKVSVLARIRLREKYADIDLIPFDNLFSLELAAQEIQAEYNSDVQVSAAKEQKLNRMIEEENSYKRVQNGAPIEVYVPLSGGSIKNIVFGKL